MAPKKRTAGLTEATASGNFSACDGNGNSKRFSLTDANEFDKAGNWLRDRGLDMYGNPLEGECPDAGAEALPESVERASVDGDHAGTVDRVMVAVPAEGTEVQSSSRASAAEIGVGGVSSEALCDGLRLDTVVETNTASVGPCLSVADDHLAAAIMRRAASVSRLGEFWGLFDWIVWGWLHTTRVLVMFHASVLDLFSVFCDHETGSSSHVTVQYCVCVR